MQFYQKVLILIKICSIFFFRTSTSDLLMKHCNFTSNVCTFHLISDFFDDVITFKSNKTSDKVKDVFFENSKVPPLEKVFQFFPHLEHFAVENCDLETMNRESFENGTNLRVLRLQYNKIGDLTQKHFEFVPNLEEIRLDHNKISNIEPSAFFGLSNLTILTLQHNLIEKISYALFEPLVALSYLDLSYNRIETIDGNMFKNISDLRTIILNNNRIVSFEGKTFLRFKYLDYLDLSFNVIEKIWLQNVKKLVLNNAAVSECHVNGTVLTLIANNNFLKGVDIKNSTFLQTVEVRNNSFNNVANFSQSYLIENFDISANNLRILDAGKLFNFLQLISLKIAATELENLTDETFMFQKDLKELDLSYNYLGHITSGLLEPMKNLERLYLSANNLKEIDYHNLHESHPRLREIDIQNNKWNCSYLSKMILYFQNNGVSIKSDFKHKTYSKSHINGIFCEVKLADDQLESVKEEIKQINKNKSNLNGEDISNEEEVIIKPEQSQEGNTRLIIDVLIFCIVSILLILQIVKFVRNYVNTRSTTSSDSWRTRGVDNHTRLMEETEHL